MLGKTLRALGAGVLVAAALSGLVAARAEAPSVVPAQYLAKLFTEGLGRAPDQPGWNNYAGLFTRDGCTLSSLAHVGSMVLESPELTDRYGNDAYALAEIAFRALLNREASLPAFKAVVSDIATRGWHGALLDVFNSGEFRSLSGQICSTASSSYGFNDSTGVAPAGVAGPIAACTSCLPVTVPKGAVYPTEGQLRLLASMPGEVIQLAPRAVIPISQPLTLAPNVVIETYGNPEPTDYIDMARLVRNWNTNPRDVENATIVLQGGAQLRNVWVSGQRSLWRNTVTQSLDSKDPQYPNAYGQIFDADDVRTYGGFGTSVTDDRLDDSPGWTALELFGADSSHGCVNNVVARNLIEAYSSVHIAHPQPDWITPWSDGISDHCQSSAVTMNQVIDASDVPIVLFEYGYNPGAAVPAQTSQVSSNVIVSAGNSAYSAMAADPGYSTSGAGDPDGTDGSQEFTGSMFGGDGHVPVGSNPTAPGEGNLFWTGPRTHFNAAVSDGTIDFFGPKIAYVGRGAAFVNNTTGIESANAPAGIVVSGMMDTLVRGNNLRLNLFTPDPGTVWRCPGAEHAVEWYFPRRASGTVQDNPQAVEIPPSSAANCIVSGT